MKKDKDLVINEQLNPKLDLTRMSGLPLASSKKAVNILFNHDLVDSTREAGENYMVFRKPESGKTISTLFDGSKINESNFKAFEKMSLIKKRIINESYKKFLYNIYKNALLLDEDFINIYNENIKKNFFECYEDLNTNDLIINGTPSDDNSINNGIKDYIVKRTDDVIDNKFDVPLGTTNANSYILSEIDPEETIEEISDQISEELMENELFNEESKKVAAEIRKKVASVIKDETKKAKEIQKDDEKLKKESDKGKPEKKEDEMNSPEESNNENEMTSSENPEEDFKTIGTTSDDDASMEENSSEEIPNEDENSENELTSEENNNDNDEEEEEETSSKEKDDSSDDEFNEDEVDDANIKDSKEEKIDDSNLEKAMKLDVLGFKPIKIKVSESFDESVKRFTTKGNGINLNSSLMSKVSSFITKEYIKLISENTNIKNKTINTDHIFVESIAYYTILETLNTMKLINLEDISFKRYLHNRCF